MAAVKFTAKNGVKLLGGEAGSWLFNGVADNSATQIDLVENGALTESAVNTGAGLTAFSGFSVFDYLEQAYSPALDFGVNPFFIRCSIKALNNSSVNTLYERDSAVTGQRITALMLADGTISFTVDDNATVRTATTAAAYDDGEWHSFIFLYDGAGGVFIQAGSSVDGSTTGAPLLTMDNAAAIFRVGLDAQGENPASECEITLLVVSGNPISPLQALLINNQEKELFNKYENLTIEGNEYELDLSLGSLDSSDSVESHPIKSIGGNQETNFIHRDTNHNFTIINRQRENLSEIKNFFRSVEGAEDFTFDPYGTVAEPDTPIIVKADAGYKPRRNGTNDEFSIPMKVREV